MCNKVQFSKKEATTALNERKNKGKKWSREVRIYECPECKKWHLTSELEYEEREYLSLEDLKYADKWKKLQE